ncbi:aminoglycoside phosphotransferase family protein [Actinopolymorpha sp. NPDC004070]|uniref:aminoglycoside phosphotransferase family protein n=1 Tax=Actinopolymorpha sp. NPDC004070 TaxID=3154548 RepID=UPI0033B1DC30
MSELPGGRINKVVRIGNTVRRRPPGRPDDTRALLNHFEDRGWAGAPRFLGVDDEGRQILSYVPGWVPLPRLVAQPAESQVAPPGVWSDESLAGVARLVREFHDLTAATPLAEDQETLCHNDLTPNNTVYRDAGDGSFRPVAFIDWDDSTPGPRIHDVADICWMYPSARFAPDRPDPKTLGRLMRLMCDAYGLPDRSALITIVLTRHDQTWRGIADLADAGHKGYQLLRDLGAVEFGHANYEWTKAHRVEIEHALCDA